jgi:hypothetical protein
MMSELSKKGDSQPRSVVDAVMERSCLRVRLPLVGQVNLPPVERLAYFVGVGALAAVELIDWPVAIIIATGHVLADQHVSRVAKGLGEALEDA